MVLLLHGVTNFIVFTTVRLGDTVFLIKPLVGRNRDVHNFDVFLKTKHIRKTLKNLKNKDLQALVAGKPSICGYPKSVTRELLYYLHKTGDIKTTDRFIHYYERVVNEKKFIPYQYKLFLAWQQNNPSKKTCAMSKEFNKALFGEHWEYFFSKILEKRGSPYDVKNVARKRGISEKEAKKVVKKLKKETCGSLDRYIKTYGMELGTLRFEQFKEKSTHTKEKYLEKYGKRKGKKVWDALCASRDSSSLEFYVNKYGKKKGELLFASKCEKSKITFDTFLAKYADKKLAKKKYKSYILRKTKYFQNKGAGGMLTKESLEFFRPIKTYCRKHNLTMVYGSNKKRSSKTREYLLWDTQRKRVCFYDFYIKELKHIIEFDGGTHPSPLLSEKELSRWRCFLSGVSAETKLHQDFLKEDLAIRSGNSLARIHVTEYQKNPSAQVARHINIIRKLRKNYENCSRP